MAKDCPQCVLLNIRKRKMEQQAKSTEDNENLAEEETNQIKRMKRNTTTTEASSNEGTWFGAATSDVPGTTIYNDWKPPEKQTRQHSKTFYLELENDNWVMDKNGSFNYCIPPYYNMMWHALPWYLDFGEYECYRNTTNWAKIKNVVFQVNVVGHRLPFTTNEESSLLANSQVDQTLDVFRSMEKRMPHGTCYKKEQKDRKAQDIDKNPYSEMCKTLYGYVAHGKLLRKIPAYNGYRKWRYMPKYYVANSEATEYAEWENHPFRGAGWPDFGNYKWQSVDLRTYRGPIATIAYEPKGGLIGQAPSILLKMVQIGTGNFVAMSEQQLYKSPIYGLVTHRHLYAAYQKNGININTCNGGWRNNSAALYFSSNVDCEYQTNTRQEPIIPCYQSLFLGVRPQMNGSLHQKGILQIEVKTFCEVEYQFYHAVPIPIPWKNDVEIYNARDSTNNDRLPRGFSGLSNDLDMAKYSGQCAIPRYACGNKLVMNLAPTLHDIDNNVRNPVANVLE